MDSEATVKVIELRPPTIHRGILGGVHAVEPEIGREPQTRTEYAFEVSGAFLAPVQSAERFRSATSCVKAAVGYCYNCGVRSVSVVSPLSDKTIRTLGQVLGVTCRAV